MIEKDFEYEVVRIGLPLFVKPKEATKLMSVGPTKLRAMIQDGQIEGFKRGKKDLVIKTASILRFNASLPPARFSPKSKDAA